MRRARAASLDHILAIGPAWARCFKSPLSLQTTVSLGRYCGNTVSRLHVHQSLLLPFRHVLIFHQPILDITQQRDTEKAWHGIGTCTSHSTPRRGNHHRSLATLR
nr:hypothetical protein CFP56_43889 [Quercus suber]